MNTNNYLPTIGLEIHAELKTSSKMFCSCRNNPDEKKPNINICPICLGHPGTLPVLNMEAIRHVLKVGIATNGTLADFTEWDRKNYFYPDIPKGYQVSQYKFPLVTDGELAGIAIERIHLEEDTAQSTHDREVSPSGYPLGETSRSISFLNFDRSGVPLMELVTKPVIHDAATAVRFAKELQLLLRTIGASDANMEKGEMRVEANISIAPITEMSDIPVRLGMKTEIKNLNSFRSVERAIKYEIARQTSILDNGEKVIQETRGWDDKLGETYSQRSKESSHDYRYFPEPDIPKLKISEILEFSPETLKKDLPELPSAKRERLKNAYAMTDKEIAVFVESPELADYFEAVISAYSNDSRELKSRKIKLTVNYLLTDYFRNRDVRHPENDLIPPSSFAELIIMLANGTISSRGAKDMLALALKNPRDSAFTGSFETLAEKHNLIQMSDAGLLVTAIEKVITDNTSVVAEYKGGKVASLQFLIGQVMKATKGSANPEMLKKILIEKLA